MTRPTIEFLELPLPEDPGERRRFLAERRRAQRRLAWERSVTRWGNRATATFNWCYGGAVKVVQFPFYSLDLLDRHGKPDYSKLCPFLVCQELLVIQGWDTIRNGRAPQASVLIIIAVLSFASATIMREFIAQVRAKYSASDITKSVTEDRRVDVNVTQRLIDERNPVDGSAPQSAPATGAMVPE